MRVPIEEVISGMEIERDVVIEDVLLVNAGQKLTPNLINRLKRYGITNIDIVSDQKENSTEENIENTVNDDLYERAKASLNLNNIDKIEEVANEIVASVLKIANLEDGFAKLKYDVQTFSKMETLDHTIRVAIFSIMLAYIYNEDYKKKTKSNLENNLVDLSEVAMAALMCEKGRNCYKQEVLEQISSLKENETLKKLMPGLQDVPLDRYDDNYISLYSYCLIENVPEFSKRLKYMVLFSAENENKTGPLKIQGITEEYNNIKIGANIIRICNLYDNFLAHCYHTHESFENVITILGQAASTKTVNEDLTMLFLKNIPIYPLGSIVELSNGMTGRVIVTNTGYTYAPRPIVRVLETKEIIDLKETTNITIKAVQTEKETLENIMDGQVEHIKRGR